MSNPNPSANVAAAPPWFRWLGVAALAAYAIFLVRHTTIVAGGSDSSGYLNSARLLAAGRLQADLRLPDVVNPETLRRYAFQPLGFSVFPGQSQLTPTYPSGLPLHYALAGRILGWKIGPQAVQVGAALAVAFLTYAVARQLGLMPWFAFAGSAAVAVFPPLLFTAIQPLSDTLATAWCLAAMGAALKSRHLDRWAGAAGFAFGVGVLVRPTNIALLPALIAFIGLRRQALLLLLAGGVPPAAWLGFYNHALYGGVLRTGYPGIEDAFRWEYVAPTALHFARWLAVFLPAIFLVLPFVTLFRRATRTREVLALALWFGGIAAVYVCYAISHESWSCLRFLLPAIPALVFAALLGLETLWQTLPARSSHSLRIGSAVVLVLWTVAGSWHWTRKLGTLFIPGYEQVYADAMTMARARFPANTLVVAAQASGSLYHDTPFPVLRWDRTNPVEFSDYARRAAAAGIPIGAVLFKHEETETFNERCPGEWTRLGGVGNVGLWQLVAPRVVLK
jgi:hypothetical protein